MWVEYVGCRGSEGGMGGCHSSRDPPHLLEWEMSLYRFHPLSPPRARGAQLA